ncbi:hypothetical protein GOBAR_AA15243 [Gossypium barbadense]|uniref:Uncharacterized protein n=1 Tax=Gossypium barbadense TaxID=3634 RepID=A0A2P5XQ16_GOSBA|nr:hypothetical protein GOBAR_AA15243 [Gossypium barbadense]
MAHTTSREDAPTENPTRHNSRRSRELPFLLVDHCMDFLTTSCPRLVVKVDFELGTVFMQKPMESLYSKTGSKDMLSHRTSTRPFLSFSASDVSRFQDCFILRFHRQIHSVFQLNFPPGDYPSRPERIVEFVASYIATRYTLTKGYLTTTYYVLFSNTQ